MVLMFAIDSEGEILNDSDGRHTKTPPIFGKAVHTLPSTAQGTGRREERHLVDIHNTGSQNGRPGQRKILLSQIFTPYAKFSEEPLRRIVPGVSRRWRDVILNCPVKVTKFGVTQESYSFTGYLD